MKKCIILTALLLTASIFLSGCMLASMMDKAVKVIAQNDNAEEKDKLQEFVEEILSTDLSHEYVVESAEGELLAPDGTVLASYSYAYPVFEANNGDKAKYIATINETLKENAISMIDEANRDYEMILEEYENIKEHGWRGIPNQYFYDFDIHIDAKGIISLTEIWSYYTGGAHGSHVHISHNFDVSEGKELLLSDLLYGTDKEIADAFTKEFAAREDVDIAFFDDPAEVVPKELPKAQYFVDSEGVTAYFQEYQVGPYAEGFVSATISDKEMLKFDFRH